GVTAAAPMMMAAAPGAGGGAAAAAAPEEEQTEFDLILTDFGANKINVIKVVRELTALGLKDAKDLVEAAPKTVKEAMPKAEAVRRILRGRAADLAPVYFEWLAAQKVLAVQGDQVTLPGRSAQLTGEESKLSTAVLERFEKAGLSPPGPGEVAAALGAKTQILEGVLRHLVARGQLVKLPSGLILAASALAELRRDLLATPWDRFSVADFKDRFGLTRKWAIPLLEHLDSTGATRRLGDERMVVRPGGP
ncbi:hypothetical protein EHM82_05755, partial [bacterium]